VPRPAAGECVEQVARQHIQALAAQDESGPVYYVENTLINSLFGLLCWEAVFSPVPGAFFHPFQTGPADLLSADFHSQRAELFEQALSQLRSGQYQHTIRATFKSRHGILSPFVCWELLDATLLDLALACLPGAHLEKMFERLLADIGANRSGFPDLIQFWPRRRRYRMIEVKGPGDRLQDNQIRFLEFCAHEAIPVAVCHVEWTPEGGRC